VPDFVDKIVEKESQPYIERLQAFWAENQTTILVVGVIAIAVIIFFGVLQAQARRNDRRRAKRNRY
jgi:hypothetical protein